MNKFIPQEHQDMLITRFILRDKKERLKTLLKSKRGRIKLRNRLAHNIDFDPRFITIIPNNQQTTKLILELLRHESAPSECYIISEDVTIDGKILNLTDALDRVIGSGMGSIISCIPGKLAYFEGEDINHRFLVKRDD